MEIDWAKIVRRIVLGAILVASGWAFFTLWRFESKTEFCVECRVRKTTTIQGFSREESFESSPFSRWHSRQYPDHIHDWALSLHTYSYLIEGATVGKTRDWPVLFPDELLARILVHGSPAEIQQYKACFAAGDGNSLLVLLRLADRAQKEHPPVDFESAPASRPTGPPPSTASSP
ncbi:MAG: hypothetical protein BWX88_04482 [Planctomycetes bacterium ADurb.Bin126]|nr:MAG: hypothetical protein BWX88_04482 [Planctomycetes bacterium ADurb.Bin126]HQL73732.1 hypothetical protein [Phycisphaerae bacterium]